MEEQTMKVVDFKLENNMWTNGLYKLVVTIDTELESIKTEVLEQTETHTMVYGERDGFVSYGAIDKTGYRWSSRASVFNGQYDKKCMEIVCIDAKGRRYGIDMLVDEVLKYIPDDFYIIEQTETDEHGDISEITYYISNREHEKSKQWYFKDIQCDEGSRYISNRLHKVA
jgi:hypothetical protein